MQYRRANTKGGTYFFTVNIANRSQTLLIDYYRVLRTAIRKVKNSHPFQIDAMVVLPDHLHVIWTLPPGDSNFATRWRLIKSGFSRQIPKLEYRRKSRITKNERGIWQRRYWEHCIRDQKDYNRHIEYIHYNPVKHSYVTKPADWRYSSIHRYIRMGIIDNDWGNSTTPEFDGVEAE